MQTSKAHFVTYPFALRDANAGGLPSVLLREATLGGADIKVLSIDTESGPYKGLEIRGADPELTPNPERFKLWFGTGHWPLLFPDAFTSGTTPDDVLASMFEAHQSSHHIGSFEALVEYCNAFAPSEEAATKFTSRFDRLFTEIPAGSTVNFQDYFFAPSVATHIEALRARNCETTFHAHTAISPHLIDSEWGRSFLKAMSQVDTVYVHTDRFVHVLSDQLERMRERGLVDRMPMIRRFDLGIDQGIIEASLQTVNRDNFQNTIPDFHQLPEGQQELIKEIFATQGVVPHRFFNGDRIDPTKGLATVIDAIDGFLQNEMARGLSVDDLRANYRFFFLHDLLNGGGGDPTNLSHRYINIIKERHDRLAEKYPEIVWVAGGLKGKQRIAIASLTVGCHGLTGGTEEGLGLMVPEILFANKNQPTSGIIGLGSGFARQAHDLGLSDGAYFPEPGVARGFIDALVSITRSTRDRLLGGKAKLVDYIAQRSDSVVVGK